MKQFFTTYVLLFCLLLGAQTPPDDVITEDSGQIMLDTSNENSELTEMVPSKETFAEIADKNNVPFRTINGIENFEDGYYAIAGVFSKGKNLRKVIKKLKRKGFDAGSMKNPENDLHYGNYNEDVWILELNGNNTNNESYDTESSDSNEISIDDVTYDELTESEQSSAKQIKSSAKGNKNYTFDVIQKAADAHYFNTNMEKAFQWYNTLYENYGKEMSADNIFKYAHSLKGTGKYARSKRLMRLYDKKIKNGEYASIDRRMSDPTANEIVLDNILSSKQNFEIKNLAINTQYSDFSPMFLDSSQIVYASAKDSSFLNTRRYKWNNQPFLDLYVAKINKESQDLKNAIKFSKKINTKYHEASVTFSPDNETMYFTRNNYGKKLGRDKNGTNHLKIYISNKVNGEWTEAKEVPFNSDDYSTGHPALSPDGTQLYFVSDMPGSLGQTDIFVVDVLGGNTFSDPKNLGPEINTEKKEMFPFINDKKLYFSSDGHVGLGGLDVYEVAYTEEGFEEVKNVGQPVNSRRDDFSYIVNEENQKGYFASNRSNGKGDDDIYSFKRLVIEEIPAVKNAVAGVVTELITGDIMPNALVELLDENGIKLKEMVADDDGSFVFEDLEADKSYTIKATKDTYGENLQSVTAIENDTVQVDLAMTRLEELIAIEDGIKKLKLDMIHFDFDKFNIRQDASEELDKLHTDSRGKRAYNKYLSDKRAKSSRDYIISKGISADRIESATGYGEERLLNGCDGSIKCTEQQHFMNRRSEFVIVKFKSRFLVRKAAFLIVLSIILFLYLTFHNFLLVVHNKNKAFKYAKHPIKSYRYIKSQIKNL